NELLGHIALVREINSRFDQGERLDQPLPPGLGPPTEQTTELTEGLAPLRLGLRPDQVSETLHSGEVEPANLEGPTGELPRLGKANPGQCAKRLEHRRDDSPAPVDLEFSQILAGLAPGSRKPKRQRLVEEKPGRGVSDLGQCGASRLGDSADEPLKREPRG